jgi:hypothetical protein
MDSNSDITLQVLIDMRSELRGLREEQKTTNDRLDQLSRRVDQTNRQLQITEIRLATEISALRAVVAEVAPEPSLEQRVDRCERAIAELRAQR